jgi:hypothetical protein
MKRSLLAIALLTPVPLLTSCSQANLSFFNSSRQDIAAAQAPTTAEADQPAPAGSRASFKNLQKAQQLAWEAATLVQKPPHSSDVWQESRVKWRQAIRLLEDFSPGSAEFAWAQKRLPTYRANYTAISQRLTLEQTATDDLKRAQSLAWQAAVTAQSPPHSLAVWERASSKWAEASAILAAIPPYTSVTAQAKDRLATYRQNYAAIARRIQIEEQIEANLTRFSDLANRFKTNQLNAINGQSSDPIGIQYEDYQALVQSLEKDLNNLSKQPNATQHPQYQKLTEALADYKFALTLWRSYLDYKRANAAWLHDDDFFNQLLPLSRINNISQLEKYPIKLYQGAREPKIPLKFALWEIWEAAGRKTHTAQQEMARLDNP